MEKQQWQLIEEESSHKNSLDWTGLPDGVLEMIFERLSFIDCISFSNVCKSWASIVMPDEFSPSNNRSRGLPWLVMSSQHGSKTRTCFSILEHRIWSIEIPKSYGQYIWGSFEDWLIMVRYIKEIKQIDISLLNPFSRNKILLPRVDNKYHKLVLSGSPYKQSCVYMLLGKPRSPAFALWSQGSKNWYVCNQDFDPFVDGVFYNGCFYLTTIDFDIQVVDVTAFKASEHKIKLRYYQVKMHNITSEVANKGYLMESCGEILLVCQFSRKHLLAYKVFQLDLGKMTWVNLDDLSDRVLFVGGNSSGSCFAKDLGGEMENCIYFTNGFKTLWHNEWDYSNSSCNISEIDDWGIFSVSCDGFENFPCLRLAGVYEPIWISAPIWLYCQMNKSNSLPNKDNINIIG